MPWLTDPSITNQVQPPPNPLAQYAQFAQIKNLGVQNQLAQQHLQQEQQMAPVQQQTAQANLVGQQQQNQVTAQQLQTKQLVQKLAPQFTKSGADGSPGLDFDGLANAVLQNGGDPSVINALQKQRNDAIESTAKAGKSQIELNQSKTNLLYQGIQGVKAFPDGDPRREGAYQQQLAKAKQAGIDVSQFPPQAPNNDSLTLLEGQLGMTGQLLAEAKTKAEMADQAGNLQRQQAAQVETARHNRAEEANARAKEGREAANASKPKTELAVTPDGTAIEIKAGMKVPDGTKPASQYGKPTADEQRRADLSQNLNENLDTLEEIVNRRPDLFGPVAGRWTALKNTVGTNDPDIATLETIKHQMGMAQISAHGMRSAQGIGDAANSLVNNFNNEPNAIKASISAARKSVKTFQDDVDRTKNPNKTGTALSQPMGGAPAASGGFNWNQFPEHK